MTNVRQVLIPMSDGLLATLWLPERLTPQAIHALEGELVRVCSVLRRDAQAECEAREAGATEVDSWALRA